MSHQHDHGVGLANRRRLVVAIAIIATFLVVEVVGAFLSGSLAVLAHAGHMLSDLIGLFIALGATVVAMRPADARRTFGHRRVEVFAAFVNAVLLGGIVVWIVVEALGRLLSDESAEVLGGPMLIIAILGALAN